MCERIRADDRLGRCNSNAGNGLDHAACAVDLGGLDVAANAEVVGTGLERHNALLHRGVACALADAVDGALDLVNTGLNACQRVCNCHAEVVVHVAGQDYVLDTLGVLTQILDAGCVLLRDHVADGIRNVDGSSTGLDGGFNDAAQEVEVGAGRILSGELDVRTELLGEGYVVRYGFQHLIRCHLQLVLHVYRAGCQEGVNAGRLCTADGVPCRLDVLLTAARQRADGSAAHGISDCCDGSRITGRSSRKACFNDIYLEGFELLCNLDLLIQVHAAAGRLLTVTQRRIKNLNCSSHGILSSPIQNFTGLTGTKKAPSLNPIIKRRSESSAVPLLLPQYGATPLCTSDNALPL